MDGNSITIVGNLTRDIEIKYVGTSNIPKGTFSVARSWYVGEGEAREQRAEFFDCEVWREQALNLAQSAGKGTRVIVSGILRQDRWQNADGESRTKVRIEVVDVGPALRFATAEVHKNARPEGGVPATVGAPAPADEAEVVFDATSEEPF